MKTPKHFNSSWSFTAFILDMALRDRETMMDASTPRGRKPDPGEQEHLNEVAAEIAAIKARIAQHNKPRKTRTQ